MAKDNTWLYVAGGGVLIFILYKTGVLKGIGDAVGGVGEGIGTAGQAGGLFVKETLIEGGSVIREASNQFQNTIKEAGGFSQDILSEDTGLRGVEQNIGGTIVDTTGFLRKAVNRFTNELLQQENRVFSVDDKIIQGAKNVLSYVPAVLEDTSGVLSGGVLAVGNTLKGSVSSKDIVVGGNSVVEAAAAKYITTEPISGGNLNLPSSSVAFTPSGLVSTANPSAYYKPSQSQSKGLLSRIGSSLRNIF